MADDKIFARVVRDARRCRICETHLPHGVNPVFRVHPRSRILVIGQAPGKVVHASGVPWADASGKRLRNWLGVTEEQFNDAANFGILPMGFCFPGSGKSGDLPPRPECAPTWHPPLMEWMPDVRLTLLFGKYAQQRYLGRRQKKNLTETVANWKAYLPEFLPLPHPSPRNNIWLRKNLWFETEVLPWLKKTVAELLLRKPLRKK